jgi:hypothetical protein
MTTRPLAILLSLVLSLSAVADESGRPSLPLLPTQTASVTGFVTTVSGNLITILNGAVTVDATGATFRKRDGSATIADVKPGSQIFAQIRNPQAPAGTLLQASTVVILDPPAGILNGPVQSVDVAGSALTMFGVRIVVTPDTRIQTIRRQEGPSTLADVKPGDHAAVEVSISGSTLVAEAILVLPPIPNKILEGTVKSITPSTWVIATDKGDVPVTVNNQTRIDPGVQTGDAVVVMGTADADGRITALTIIRSILRPLPPVSDFAVEGTVKSIGASSWVITKKDQTDVTVAVTSNTKIDRSIKVGDAVVVLAMGRRDEAGNLIAIAIMKSGRNRAAAR